MPDSIPVYNLVHWIREEICANVDTTLTYEQLRTPQVSSFVVKPILSALIRTEDDLSRAAYIYSLMANCLQFRKEMEDSPATMGTSKTRALLCELLAIKLLKEYSTRELVRPGPAPCPPAWRALLTYGERLYRSML